ncbi:MAG: DedA family protein [Wenzhouxiangella sp.]
MDNGLIGAIVEFAESHTGWLVVLAFVFAFLESLAVVGILVPGIVLLFLVGAVIGMDAALFLACWLAASGGALLGDGISYWLGARFRHRIPGIWPLSRRPDLLTAGQLLFARHGGKGVFIGRFIGPIRPVIPLVAGMMTLRPTTFLAFAVPACLLWAPLYLLPGMVFGASLELAAEFAGRLAVLLLITVMGVWLVLWLTRLVYGITARRSAWWMRSLIRWSSESALLGRVFQPLLDPRGREVISVGLLGVLLLVSFTVLVGALIAAPFASATWDAERQMAGWAASLRNHFADPFFVALSLAAERPALSTLSAGLLVLLLVLRRSKAAWHWLVVVLGGFVLIEGLHGLMGLLVDKPSFMPTLGEVPHRGFAMATMVFGFFAVMLAKDLQPRRRKWPYLFSSAVLALAGFAHFYLGLASITGLLAALALGLAWTALVGIAYRQRAPRRRRPLGLALAFYALFAVIAVAQVPMAYDGRADLARPAQPERLLVPAEWVQSSGQSLPDRVSRIGRPERTRFDVQIAADLPLLEATLRDAGWETTGRADSRALASLLVARPTVEDLPHLSRDFAGLPEALMMRRVDDEGRVFLLRLWFSGGRLEGSGVPVWLGQLREVRPQSGLILVRWVEIDEGRQAAGQALEEALLDWLNRRDEAAPVLYADPSLRPSPSSLL